MNEAVHNQGIDPRTYGAGLATLAGHAGRYALKTSERGLYAVRIEES